MTNLVLIHSYILGDDHALATLFFQRDYFKWCFSKAYFHLKPDDNNARDVVSDVLEALLKKSVLERSSLFLGRSESNFLNYILRMTQNKAIDYYRQRRRFVELPLGYDPLEPSPPDPDQLTLNDIKSKTRDCAKNLYLKNEQKEGWDKADLIFLEICLRAGSGDLGYIQQEVNMTKDEIRKTKQRIKRRLEDCPEIRPYINLII